jgi:hypothetical protein
METPRRLLFSTVPEMTFSLGIKGRPGCYVQPRVCGRRYKVMRLASVTPPALRLYGALLQPLEQR